MPDIFQRITKAPPPVVYNMLYSKVYSTLYIIVFSNNAEGRKESVLKRLAHLTQPFLYMFMF